MFLESFLSTIRITRPLLFLCGPLFNATNPTDRRKILFEHILKNFKGGDYQAFPVIVDNLFQPEKIEKFKLKVSLLEEIAAAVSFRTYIFLDTMSTSYELGQFTNSKENNFVRVFLPKQKSESIKIGAYIDMSLNSGNIPKIEYDNFIKENYIYFESANVPDQISEIIEEDRKTFESKKQEISIDFIKRDELSDNKNSIIYYSDENKLNLRMSLKMMFYLISFKMDKLGVSITKEEPSLEFLSKVISSLKNDLYKALIIKTKSYDYISKDTVINLFVDNYENSMEIIYHIYCFMFLLASSNDNPNAPKKINADIEFSKNKSKYHFNISLSNLFKIKDEEMEILKMYRKNPLQFIKPITLRMHGKIRKLYTYKNDYNGKRFRQIHKKINYGFKRLLPTSNNSFAYKEGLNTLSAVKPHKNSKYFIKLDLEKYFENIKYNCLKGSILELMKNNPYYSLISSEDLSQILLSCFYHGKCPIGFITSPILSDYYLYDLDCAMANNKDLVYTRYADDILFSSKRKINDDDLDLFRVGLFLRNLKTNQKCMKRNLINVGDSIKFLGLNIVLTNNGNIIKVSNSLIKSICLALRSYYSKLLIRDKKYDKLNGMISYIRSVDEKSYIKIKEKVYKKSKISIRFPLLTNLAYFQMLND